MTEATKIVKGGFRATLALLISILALILAAIAFMRTAGEEDLPQRVRDLQSRLEGMRQESAQRIETLREETADALESMGKAVRKKPEEAPSGEPPEKAGEPLQEPSKQSEGGIK